MFSCVTGVAGVPKPVSRVSRTGSREGLQDAEMEVRVRVAE